VLQGFNLFLKLFLDQFHGESTDYNPSASAVPANSVRMASSKYQDVAFAKHPAPDLIRPKPA